MAEDSGTATLGSTKRCREQVASQFRPKRVKVDTRPCMGANPPNSSPDTPQGTKKSPKRRDAAGYPKSRQEKEKVGGKNINVGRRRRDGPETRKAADVAIEAETDTRDRPVSERRPHGFRRTLPNVDPIVDSSEPGRHLEGEEVEDTSPLGTVEGAAGGMDTEDWLERLARRVQQWQEGFNNDAPDKV